ncbi:protein of unknown function [Mariniphaga anaerophila]|uniref:DUF349 domain-containing protein n=1 Tax=Mariniphaga anaerophila TaxID=1484053 RepID=A0A1M5E743_9BACT|nr:DUF349 domain-containing protein [Mariniphaga anaerophila]SHF74871.1 protein of unknown function [Mariniphaga anaerophila]
MEPKDLKKPEGLESSQNANDEKSGNSVASTEQTENLEKTEKSEESNQLNEPETNEVSDSNETVSAENQDAAESSVPEVKQEAPVDAPSEEETDDESEEPAEETTVSEQSESLVEEAESDSEVEPKNEEVSEEEDLSEETESSQEKAEVVAEAEEEPENDEKADAATESAPEVKEKAEPAPAPPKREKVDYNTYKQIELVNALRDVLEKDEEYDIRDEVEAIRSAFYKQVKEEHEQQKKQFLEEGGNEEEFVPEENPYEQDIKDLLKRYRQIRHEFNKKLEQEKETNLQIKYDIIEEIKGLIHKEESINKTFQEFRDLQQRWREIGLVPQGKMKDLWDTYHFHVENFYDYIKINKELRDLDLKKNLEMKIRLCEQAEELLLETNTIKAFNHLQKLHERWREIGPAPRENKDDIWERFKAATAKINKKHQEYFESRKTEQKKNLEAKRALCEQVEEINETEFESHKDWGEKSKEVVNLQKVWRTIGFASRKENNKIYTRFREACDKFFDAKRDFYSKNKELQQNNLQLKIDLCMQAEALKDSDDWRKTTQDLINIQKQWKEIGPVPRKHSDALWKRFRAACDFFFDKKSEHFSSVDSEQVDNLKEKEQLIADVRNFEPTDDADENLRMLKDFQRRWTEIGHVPIKKKDEVQKQFRDAINKLFDDLNLDESRRNMLKFRTKMASFSESSRGQNKMRLERDKYMNKLKQLENDLVLLDNNIGFFAKSKNAESLIEDVKKKIEQTRERIESLKDKIRVIDEMDQSEED